MLKKRIILEGILVFLLMFFYINICSEFIGRGLNHNHVEKLILVTFAIMFGRVLFVNYKLYYKIVAIWTFLYSSIILLLIPSKEMVIFKDISNGLGFSIVLVILLISITKLINK